MSKTVGLNRPDAGHRQDMIDYDIKTQRPLGKARPGARLKQLKWNILYMDNRGSLHKRLYHCCFLLFAGSKLANVWGRKAK